MSESHPPARKRSCWKILLAVILVIAIVLAALWWWHNRSIQPVQLSVEEKVVVEKKLAAVQRVGESIDGEVGEEEQAEPVYEKGEREFILTERELNGLLNEHTSLGGSLRFELVAGAVHARVAVDLDPGLPIVGGKRLKARARFLAETRDGVPELILDDLTVWGISVPNDWLGGIKGRNLLGEVLGGGMSLSGVEKLEVARGRLVIRLKK